MNNSLNNLFEQWKQAHSEEVDFESTTRKYKGRYVNKENFCIDGFVGAECKKGVSILFIMKESNLQGYDAKKDYFWFAEVYHDNRKKIPRRLRKCAEKLGCEYEKCAYMNINKRGGIDNADNRVIKNYFNRYKCEIIEEIRILNPEVILIASEELKEIVYSDLKKEFSEKKFYFTKYHPSVVKRDGYHITDDYFLSDENLKEC